MSRIWFLIVELFSLRSSIEGHLKAAVAGRRNEMTDDDKKFFAGNLLLIDELFGSVFDFFRPLEED